MIARLSTGILDSPSWSETEKYIMCFLVLMADDDRFVHVNPFHIAARLKIDNLLVIRSIGELAMAGFIRSEISESGHVNYIINPEILDI